MRAVNIGLREISEELNLGVRVTKRLIILGRQNKPEASFDSLIHKAKRLGIKTQRFEDTVVKDDRYRDMAYLSRAR